MHVYKEKYKKNVKQRCVSLSVKGVNMWDALDEEIIMCNTAKRLKK